MEVKSGDWCAEKTLNWRVSSKVRLAIEADCYRGSLKSRGLKQALGQRFRQLMMIAPLVGARIGKKIAINRRSFLLHLTPLQANSHAVCGTIRLLKQTARIGFVNNPPPIIERWLRRGLVKAQRYWAETNNDTTGFSSEPPRVMPSLLLWA